MKQNNQKPIAYKSESAFSGIFIFGVEYGIDDYIIAAYTYSGKILPTRKSKVRHDKQGNTYFIFRGTRQYIQEFISYKSI